MCFCVGTWYLFAGGVLVPHSLTHLLILDMIVLKTVYLIMDAS